MELTGRGDKFLAIGLADATVPLVRRHGGEPAWYVLQVAVRSELTVGTRLTEKNIHNWIPMRKAKVVRTKGRKKMANSSPAFPGYILVKVVPSAAAWCGLQSLQGVLDLLRNEEEPVPIAKEEINKFAKMEAGGDLDEVSNANSAMDSLKLRRGDQVFITAGPFADLHAVFENRPRKGLVRILVSIFGRSSPVTVPLACVERQY